MHRSLLEPEFRRRGWRCAELADGRSVLLTSGDVPAEYRAAGSGAVVFDTTDRGLLTIAGADARSFLHRLLANEVRKLEPGRGNPNLLLNAKGKVLFCFDLAAHGGGFDLSLPPGQASALLRALDGYLFADKVEGVDASERHAPLDLVGPKASAIVAAVLGAPPPQAHHAWSEVAWRAGTVRATALSVAGSGGWRLDAGPSHAVSLWQALIDRGASPAGRAAYDILRVEAGYPEPSSDIDDTLYPQEARLERAFALDKGCYVGQEVVAKIDTYGGLNKRLVALRLTTDEPLPRGTRLLRQDEGNWRDLGVVTSWAYSFALDTGLALAYVKRRHQEPGTQFAAVPPQLAQRAEATASAAFDAAVFDPAAFPRAEVVELPVRTVSPPHAG